MLRHISDLRMQARTAVASVFSILLLSPEISFAHAFGQQYTLPLPFQFYALGAACALVASFVFLGLYSRPNPARANIISVRKVFTIAQWPVVEIVLRSIGVVGFIATVIFAFVGPQDFTLNPAPELFWGVLLLGFTYLSVFIGGLWRFVSPFETCARIFCTKNATSIARYPAWLGYFPAIVLYFALIWLELLSSGAGAVPSIIGGVLIGYMALSFIGVEFFGVEEWFTHADFFTVFFELIGLFAPIKLEKELVSVQPPAERLILEQTGRTSLLLFILFMLSSTAIDGLEETQIWWNTLYHSTLQMQFYWLEREIIIFASPLIFLGLYAVAVYLMRLFTRSRLQFSTLMLRFTYSLIPIAIAYNFAHYFTLLLNGMQALYAMASDPLGKGWDIFGAAHYQINIGLIGAKEVWEAQFSAILIGHIIATYVAHQIAVREFSSRAQVLFGQLPMLLLMVFYTVFGLWILSQGYQTGA